MFNSLALISLSAAVFLFIMLMISNWRNRKAYLLRMEGARAMVKRTKKLKAQREEQFKEISTLSEVDDSKTESLWLSEIEFYQNIGETICAPTDKSIKKVTTLVTKLLEPYYELFNELANSTPTDELTNVIDHAENSDNSDDFVTLEKRYQEKIDENEKLQKQIDILKQSPNAAPLPSSDDANNPDLMALLNQIMIDLSKQAELNIPKRIENLDELKVSYQAILLKLEDKLNAFDMADDEFDQTEALIEQLRSEKVDYLKKYKRSMTLLFNTYKEYAGAFGLDAPQNPDIEIDAFEKFIEDS